MCADSLVSLIPVVVEVLKDVLWRKIRRQDAFHAKEDKEVETPDRLVPTTWVVIGWSVSVVVGTFLVWFVFGADGIRPYATVISFALGGLLSVLA
jgi:hypothetical protein